MSSPLKAYFVAAYPTVWAGTEGRFYYSGLAFNRNFGDSAVFVARFVDRNDQESGETIEYEDIKIVHAESQQYFLDIPSIAVDVPRGRNKDVVYLAYTKFDLGGSDNDNFSKSEILFRRYTNGGKTWSDPITLNKNQDLVQCARIGIDPANGDVYVVYRQFAYADQKNGIYIVRSTNRGQDFNDPKRIINLRNDGFDQPETANEVLWPYPENFILGESFRTNSYPTMPCCHACYNNLCKSEKSS